jgi:hypothetical protein
MEVAFLSDFVLHVAISILYWMTEAKINLNKNAYS